MQTQTSEALAMLEKLVKHGVDCPLIAMPAPSGVSHPDYKVGYFADGSILIWARGEGYIVLDEPRTYYREDVEHLARCLGRFTQERRAELLGHEEQWVSNLHWAADGSFLGF